MKQVIALAVVLLAGFSLSAQKITWTFTSKKTAEGVYEVRLTAAVPSGWHIYSQKSPDGSGMGIPTKVSFNKNALVTLQGKTKEVGNMKKEYDKNTKATVVYYADKVEFVQTVKLKGKIKTNISGEVESMICDDRKCMPPTTEKFSIALK